MFSLLKTLFVLGLLLTFVFVCDSQLLTPDQLREKHDLGYGARTHYEMSGSRRTDMFGRVNPDYLLRGKRIIHFQIETHWNVLLFCT